MGRILLDLISKLKGKMIAALSKVGAVWKKSVAVVEAATAAIQAHHQKVQAKRAAKKAAKNQAKQQPATAPQQSQQSGSSFGTKILVNRQQHKSKFKWILLAIVIVLGFAYWWFGWPALKAFFLKYVLKILIITVGILILGYTFAIDEDKLTKYVVLIPYIIWLIDISSFLGPPYQGFKFELSLLTKTNYIAVLTSSLVTVALIYKMFDELFNRDMSFIFSMLGLLAINYYSAKWLPMFNDRLPSWLITTIFALVMLIAVLAYLKFRDSYNFNSESLAYMIMVLVFSFYWVNWSWTASSKAVIHVIWILLFCLGYLSLIPQVPKGQLYIFTSLFLIADFFFYQFDISYTGLKFPLIILISSYYGYKFTKSPFAFMNMLMIVLLVWAVSYTPVLSGAELGVDFQENKPEGPTGIVATAKKWLQAFERRITGTVEERIDVATGGYSGLVEQNQYESLGVYFADPRAGEPRFYPGQPVTIWATIRSKTYQDPVIIENFKCYVDKNDGLTPIKEADRHKPGQPLPVFKLEENDVQCTFDNGLDSGSNEVTLSAEYNFATNAYLKAYFIDREAYRTMIRENLDPLTEFGIQDKQPQPVFTNGPIEIRMKAGPLIHVSKEGFITPPILEVAIYNRQQTEDKDQRIISQWEGKVSRLNEVIILTPPDVTISTPANCQSNWDSTCPCNRPIKKYEAPDCKNSCTDIQNKCKSACRNSAGEEITSCINECSKTFESCSKDCDSLFRVSPGEGNEQKAYHGYSLTVNSRQFRNDYRDLEGDKYASFFCELQPDYKVLDSKQLVTRYFRMRVRYDYQLKNIVSVPIEPVLGVIRTDVDSMISQFSAKYGADENLVKAIIIEESMGGKHCCQEKGKNKAHNCKESADRKCEADRILTSFDGSSVGIMQINVHDDPKRHGHPEWKTSAASICGNNMDGSPKTVYDIDCNIELGIKLLREKYDADSRGRVYRCTGVTYTGWDAAIRGYNGWGGCKPTDNCNAACVERVKTYVERVNKYKQQIDQGEIDLIVSKVSQESGETLPRLEQLEPPSGPQAKDTEKADRSITISWTESPTPDVRYKIYRYKSDSSGAFSQEAQFTNNDISCTISTSQLACIDNRAVTDNQTYYYRITALRGTEESEYIQTNEVTPVKDAP